MTTENGGQPSEIKHEAAPRRKTCFVICPIGDEGSETRSNADTIIQYAVSPALGSDYEVHVAHKIEASGNITGQIIGMLWDVDLVIAVLTETNPNVMYELGVRHAFRKHVIAIARVGTKLPFDLAAERTIFYPNNNVSSIDTLIKDIKGAVAALTIDNEPDNPVTRIVNRLTVATEYAPKQYLQEQMKDMLLQFGLTGPQDSSYDQNPKREVAQGKEAHVRLSPPRAL